MSVEAQVDLLMRGTRFADEADDGAAEVPEGGELRSRMQAELRDKLRLGRPLRVYLGVDPTSTDLHVGHFVPLQKLRRFQDLGHQVVFLIGDYTATIGDPSEQTSERKRLTHEHVLELAGSYTEQAYRILDPDRTELRYNGDWLGKLSFADIIELASIFPMKQIVARRDFQRRMEQGESLRFHESLYALMQGLRCLHAEVRRAGGRLRPAFQHAGRARHPGALWRPAARHADQPAAHRHRRAQDVEELR